MDFRRMLITGGAGFVGASLAVMFREAFPELEVIGFDNLTRRGSELNLPRLRRHGVAFVHGDIRCADDIAAAGRFDILVDCAADASVQSGVKGSPVQVLQTNLMGTVHCLEAARRNDAAFLLLSTSRVYPVDPLNAIPWEELETRYAWVDPSPVPGVCNGGITEEFTLEGARSFYGASKLASELIAEEFGFSHAMPVLIDRCGILTGPWQMGKVDQGVIALWMARHQFGTALNYVGFGGSGKQVRDMLHVADLFDLVVRQMARVDLWDGRRYNIGGGVESSLSLLELTERCESISGRKIPIHRTPETSPVDLRIYITQAARATADFAWSPSRSIDTILTDIHAWVVENEDALKQSLGI